MNANVSAMSSGGLKTLNLNKMHTKEDIEKAKQYLDNEGYGTGSNFTLNAVANLMAEYTAKNCVIPAVSNSVYCNCDNPTKYTDANEKTYCKWCGKNFKQ